MTDTEQLLAELVSLRANLEKERAERLGPSPAMLRESGGARTGLHAHLDSLVATARAEERAVEMARPAAKLITKGIGVFERGPGGVERELQQIVDKEEPTRAELSEWSARAAEANSRVAAAVNLRAVVRRRTESQENPYSWQVDDVPGFSFHPAFESTAEARAWRALAGKV